MPAVKKSKGEYEVLEAWMKEEHKGYTSKLVARGIEGQHSFVIYRMCTV